MTFKLWKILYHLLLVGASFNTVGKFNQYWTLTLEVKLWPLQLNQIRELYKHVYWLVLTEIIRVYIISYSNTN